MNDFKELREAMSHLAHRDNPPGELMAYKLFARHAMDAAPALLARIDELTRERDEARAEVEALRKDAERLDWCIGVLFSPAGLSGDALLTTSVGCGCCGDSVFFPKGTDGRAAIDAAKEQSANIGEQMP